MGVNKKEKPAPYKHGSLDLSKHSQKRRKINQHIKSAARLPQLPCVYRAGGSPRTVCSALQNNLLLLYHTQWKMFFFSFLFKAMEDFTFLTRSVFINYLKLFSLKQERSRASCKFICNWYNSLPCKLIFNSCIPTLFQASNRLAFSVKF